MGKKKGKMTCYYQINGKYQNSMKYIIQQAHEELLDRSYSFQNSKHVEPKRNLDNSRLKDSFNIYSNNFFCHENRMRVDKQQSKIDVDISKNTFMVLENIILNAFDERNSDINQHNTKLSQLCIQVIAKNITRYPVDNIQFMLQHLDIDHIHLLSFYCCRYNTYNLNLLKGFVLSNCSSFYLNTTIDDKKMNQFISYFHDIKQLNANIHDSWEDIDCDDITIDTKMIVKSICLVNCPISLSNGLMSIRTNFLGLVRLTLCHIDFAVIKHDSFLDKSCDSKSVSFTNNLENSVAITSSAVTHTDIGHMDHDLNDHGLRILSVISYPGKGFQFLKTLEIISCSWLTVHSLELWSDQIIRDRCHGHQTVINALETVIIGNYANGEKQHRFASTGCRIRFYSQEDEMISFFSNRGRFDALRKKYLDTCKISLVIRV
jgi:hypothetical protein